MDFFKEEPINDRVTCIRSNTGELMYLLKGTERALLMDTTIGVKGLRAFVDALTSLPYDVVITHGHIDHAMGAPEFPDKRIYMSHADLPVYHSMQAVEGRIGYAASSCEVSADDLVAPSECDFLDITDGQIFDLGELTVEIIAVPGHTQGSIALLVKEEKTLILGDAGNSFTFLFDEQFSSPVSEYKKTLESLAKRVDGKIDRIYLCHHMMEVPPYLLQELIETCDDIIAGNTDDIPFEFMGQSGAYIAKAVDFEKMQRKDGKMANIVYRKNRIC